MASGIAYHLLSKPAGEALNVCRVPSRQRRWCASPRRRGLKHNRPVSGGRLSKLTLDIAFNIMEHLDLRSHDVLLCASYSCSAMVDAHPVLAKLTTHAREA